MASVHHPGVQVVVRRPCTRCHGNGTVNGPRNEGGKVPHHGEPCEQCKGTGHEDDQLLYPGEPFFLLRGKDRLAPYAVSAWANARALVLQVPVGDDARAADALTKAADMLDWQQRNPGLVKTGD